MLAFSLKTGEPWLELRGNGQERLGAALVSRQQGDDAASWLALVGAPGGGAGGRVLSLDEAGTMHTALYLDPAGATDEFGSDLVYFNGGDLWIGASGRATEHEGLLGACYLSSGWDER